MLRKTCTVLFIIAMVGCTKSADQTTPEGTLREYVSAAFNMKSIRDVESLEKLARGSTADELRGLKNDPELFKKTFIDDKNSSDGSIKIRDQRKISEDRHSITYELTYKSQNQEAGDNKVTTKKHAILIKEGGNWFISEVQNIKTFVEHTTDENISGEPKR